MYDEEEENAARLKIGEGKRFVMQHVNHLSGRETLDLGTTTLHIKLRATGGNKTKTPGPGAQSVLRALARYGTKIMGIEYVTPVPIDNTRRNRGRRGRRL
ncbi:hypothetical protein ZWY2020_014881 [Hordeum vulgare]|nr:hypothetical protein ZWY2020_014881 [Hordeum vulgare]